GALPPAFKLGYRSELVPKSDQVVPAPEAKLADRGIGAPRQSFLFDPVVQRGFRIDAELKTIIQAGDDVFRIVLRLVQVAPIFGSRGVETLWIGSHDITVKAYLLG